MSRQEFRFDPPERFVAGTVGEPGQRTFFLQARRGPEVVTVACEKEQVAMLAERVDVLLDEVLRRSGGAAPVPAVAPTSDDDLAPLEQPIVEEFRVGTMTLAWDPEAEAVVVEAFAVGDDDPTGDEPEEVDPEVLAASTAERDVLVVHLPGAMARSFAKRSRAVVSAGRKPCPFCQQPLDPQGHICPRQNGYRRRA